MFFRRTRSKTKTAKSYSAIDKACTRAITESLESRRLLSTWSPQDVQVGIDKETANFPTINGSGEALVVIDVGGVDYNHYALGSGYGNKVVYAHDFNSGSWDVMPYNNDAPGTGVAGVKAGAKAEPGGAGVPGGGARAEKSARSAVGGRGRRPAICPGAAD